MADATPQAKQHLSKSHASSEAVDREWDQDNQQWWDWYMSLAENERDTVGDGLIEVEPPPPVREITWEELRQELAKPFELTSEQIARFQRDSYIKLKDVVSPGALALLRRQMGRLFSEASDQLGSRFGSLEMMWEQDETIREFVMSERLARMAAELLGVSAVRLYHDNGLSKQPGCGRTPWHYDHHHFPIATQNVCTVWLPLQAIPSAMGPLEFAKGMETYQLVEDIPFNKFDTSYDRRVQQRFSEHGVEVERSSFDLGELSFHHNMNFHTAGSNRTNMPRMVLATTYFEDGARIIDAPHMVNGDWRRFIPDSEPGDIIETPLNPVLARVAP